MKIADVLKNIPNAPLDPAYVGGANTDDFVLAIAPDSAVDSDNVEDYIVAQLGIIGQDPQFNTTSDEKTYLRAGPVTKKTGTQRTFNITGDRHFGDEFQDEVNSFDVIYGTGEEINRNYVYFSLLTGAGEKGRVSILPNSDGGGEAGTTAAIDTVLQGTERPTQFAYTKPTP